MFNRKMFFYEKNRSEINNPPTTYNNPYILSNTNIPFLNHLDTSLIEQQNSIKFMQESDKVVEYLPQTNKRSVYVISNIEGGGSKKYLDDIINHYTDINFIMIINKKDLYSISFKPTDLLFLQHLLFCDIQPQDILNVKERYKFKIILSIHDFSWFTNRSTKLSDNPTKFYEYAYLYNIDINPYIIELLNSIELVIHPSKFTFNTYSRYFSMENCIIYEHNDIFINYNTRRVPFIKHYNINIANFQELSQYKGLYNIFILKEKYRYYKGFKINFITDIKYNETNWPYKLKSHNIHGLLHLNKFGETYSYALSKSINSGLPILYNGIGSIKDRLYNKNYHYFKVIDIEDDYDNNIYKLFRMFENMLDYIIENNGKYNISNDDTTLIHNELYNFIFTNTYQTNISSIIHEKLKPFAVYFPQFHNILENNINYYNGMTDITNLHEINKVLDEPLNEPLMSEYNLINITDYDLTNENIIKKQVQIAKNNCIYGFAVYYYWFSNNTVTNKNTIMEKGYDHFFKDDLDFKVFFIWANEDWKGNPAFNSNHDISNIYNIEHFNNNINNLIKYFKHSNYYKIDNKPVFYIHHPDVIDDYHLLLFEYLLNKICIQNGFDGIQIYLNNMSKEYIGFNNYSFHPNYKSTPQLDYGKYIQEKITDDCNCVFFDFDNRARLYIPNKLKLSTKYFNTNIYNQNEFIAKVLKIYKNKKDNKDNKILLINSWNEWGENMAIEPGNLQQYNYLSLIKMNLLSFLSV